MSFNIPLRKCVAKENKTELTKYHHLR